MKKINQFKTFVIIAVIAIILGVIAFTMSVDTNNIVVRVLNDGISMVQNAFVNAAHDVGNFGQSTFDLFETYDENQRLRRERYNLELARIEIALLQEQIAELREAFGIFETLNDFERIPAVTIGRDINNWHHFLTINQGSHHGVELGMAVLSPEGYLIGRITEVNQFSSRFHLMKPHNDDIRARVEVLGVLGSQGTLHGYDADTGELIVTQVPLTVEVEPGARVITSGLAGVFPRGLLAGYVVRHEISTDGLSQTLFLSNNVEYDNLRFVFIIKRGLRVPDWVIEAELTDSDDVTEDELTDSDDMTEDELTEPES